MRFARMHVGAFLSFFLAIPILAQQTGTTTNQSPPQPDPQAVAILQRSLAAMGCYLVGRGTSIKVVGVLKLADGTTVMPVTIQSQGNSRWRSDLDAPKEHKATIVNDGRGQIQHADGRVTPLAQYNTFHQRPMHIPCLTDIALPPTALEAIYLRAETTGADSLDVIQLLPADHPSLKTWTDRMKTVVWISRSTGYLAKMQYINASELDFNDTQVVEIEYSDYRSVGGLAVPFHQLTHSGEFVLDLGLNSVQLNTPPPDFTLR
jgi:hypothetical protein